jgi:Fe-S oxidoreductase
MAEVSMENLLNCALCPNLCRCECPVLQVLSREAVAPAGKARLAAMIRQNQLDWDLEILDAVANCLGCRGCSVLCPFSELSLCDELSATRLSARGKNVSLPSVDPYLNNLKKFGSPYGQKTVYDSTFSTGIKGAEVLLYAGCTSQANRPQSIKAACDLLEKAEVSYQMIDEDCCGYPAEIWGDRELACQLAAENRRKISESGAKILVTNCPECWYTFTESYPLWERSLDLEIADGPSFFLKLIKEGRLHPQAVKDEVVGFHDPCIWARTAKKIDQPRAILQSIPGLKIKEPFASGERTRCCGGGGMFQLTFPETAELIARRRLEEFPSGQTIVTSCPFCREGLLQDNRKVVELIELLAEACR